MTVFDDAFKAVIGEEGGYVDDAQDPGGETKFGISKRSYPNLDIKNLTLNDAKAIYQKNYWLPMRGDDLPPKVAFQVFDFAVNAGVKRAVEAMQCALDIPDDGIVGNGTIWSAQKAASENFALRFAVERILHYSAQSSFPKFGRGWATRAVTVAFNNI